jgi:hypothetical protein
MPYWFATCLDAWKKLAELWNTNEWKTKSREGRIQKKKLHIHRQGCASTARYQWNLVSNAMFHSIKFTMVHNT